MRVGEQPVAATTQAQGLTTSQKVGIGLLVLGFAGIGTLSFFMKTDRISASLGGRLAMIAGPAVLAITGAFLIIFPCRPPQAAPPQHVPQPAPPHPPVPSPRSVQPQRGISGISDKLPPGEQFFVLNRGLGVQNFPFRADLTTDKLGLMQRQLRQGNGHRTEFHVHSLAHDTPAASITPVITDLLKALANRPVGETQLRIGDGSDSETNRALIHAFLKQAAENPDLGCGGSHLEGARWDIAVYTDDADTLAEMQQVDGTYQRWPRRLLFYRPSPDHTNLGLFPGYIRGYANAMDKLTKRATPSVKVAAPQLKPVPTLDPTKVELFTRYLSIHAHCVSNSVKERGYLSNFDFLLDALRSTDVDWTAEQAAVYIAALFRPRTEETEAEFSAHLTEIDSSREDLIRAIYHRSRASATTRELLRAASQSGNSLDVHLSDADYKTFLAIIG